MKSLREVNEQIKDLESRKKELISEGASRGAIEITENALNRLYSEQRRLLNK